MRFLISNKLEQLEFKLEKILGFRNMQEKLENRFTIFDKQYKNSQSCTLAWMPNLKLKS